MLPLTHKDKRSFTHSVRSKLYEWKRLIFADKNSRNLFLFLLLNFSFAFVELFYGIITNSLGEWRESRVLFALRKHNPFDLCEISLRLHATSFAP